MTAADTSAVTAGTPTRAPLPIRPFLLGLATGSRSSFGLAAVSWASRPDAHRNVVRSALTSRWGRRITAVAAATEVGVDKLPQAPSRLLPQGAVARLGASAVSAVAIGDHPLTPSARGLSPVGAAIAGATVGALVGAAVRQQAKLRNLPDLPFALAEDAVAAVVAVLAARR